MVRGSASFLCLAALATTGCIEPTLDTCSGFACPDGKVCRLREGAAACLAIAGCTQMADGTSCDPGTGQDGACESGACVPVPRCGNGVIETGEACDCGDDTFAPRSDCNDRNNSDTDPLAICRTNCALRRCGDGVLDATELCEGTQLAAGLTCGTFGYYDGDLACTSLCLVDQSGCAGRCGDGTLDTEHEYCDPGITGAVVGHCADFGFSTGALGCGTSCGPAFDQCRDATVFANLLPTRDDVVDIQRGPTADEAWVALSNELFVYDEHTGLTSIASFGSASIADISSHGDRVAVAMATSPSVHLYGGAGNLIATLTPPAPCGQLVMTADATIACFTTSGVSWWDGTAWGAIVPGPAASDAMAVDASQVLYTNYTGGTAVQINAHLATPTAVTQMVGYSSSLQSLHRVDEGEAPTTPGIYGGLAYGGTGYGMVRLSASNSWELVNGTEGYRHVANVGGRTMWSGNLPQAVLLPRATVIPAVNADVYCERFLTTGTTGLCFSSRFGASGELYRFAGSSISSALTTALPVVDVFAASDDVIYYLTSSGAGTVPPSASFAPPPPDSQYWQRIVDVLPSGDKLLVGGFSRWLGHWDGVSWRTAYTTYVITAAALTDTDVVVSLDDGPGCTIYRGTPGALVQLAVVPECPSSLWVSPTGTIWGASPKGVRNISVGIDVKPLMPTTNTTAAYVAGVDDNNIWVAASESIWFWNGTTWQLQLHADGDAFNHLWASSDGVVATSTALARTSWTLVNHGSANARWTKLRLPSDPTSMRRPITRPWGIVFLSEPGAIHAAAWQDGWP